MRHSANDRYLIRGLLAVGATACLVSGCSPTTSDLKVEANAVPPEWEYAIPSDTSGFSIRVKVDPAQRVLRWIEVRPSSNDTSYSYEECTEREIKDRSFFWIFDEQNWRCNIQYPDGDIRVILWMEDGKLGRLEGRASYIETFERRPRVIVEEQAAPIRIPSAR